MLAGSIEPVMLYPASKAAVAWWVRRECVAWAQDGLRLNAVAPGLIATPMTDRLREDPNLGAFIDAFPNALGPARTPRGGGRRRRLPALRAGQPRGRLAAVRRRRHRRPAASRAARSRHNPSCSGSFSQREPNSSGPVDNGPGCRRWRPRCRGRPYPRHRSRRCRPTCSASRSRAPRPSKQPIAHPTIPSHPYLSRQRHQLDARRRLRLGRLHGQRAARPRPAGALGQLRRLGVRHDGLRRRATGSSGSAAAPRASRCG